MTDKKDISLHPGFAAAQSKFDDAMARRDVVAAKKHREERDAIRAKLAAKESTDNFAETRIDEISKKILTNYSQTVGKILRKNQTEKTPTEKIKRENHEDGSKLAWNKVNNYKVKVPATEKVEPVEEPSTKMLNASSKKALTREETIARLTKESIELNENSAYPFHSMTALYKVKNGDNVLHSAEMSFPKKTHTREQAAKAVEDHFKTQPQVELSKNHQIGHAESAHNNYPGKPRLAKHTIYARTTAPERNYQGDTGVKITHADSKAHAVEQAKKYLEDKGHKVHQIGYTGTGH